MTGHPIEFFLVVQIIKIWLNTKIDFVTIIRIIIFFIFFEFGTFLGKLETVIIKTYT